MSEFPELPAPAIALWTDLQQGRMLWELAIVGASLIAAWLVGKQIAPDCGAVDAKRAFGHQALVNCSFRSRRSSRFSSVG